MNFSLDDARLAMIRALTDRLVAMIYRMARYRSQYIRHCNLTDEWLVCNHLGRPLAGFPTFEGAQAWADSQSFAGRAVLRYKRDAA